MTSFWLGTTVQGFFEAGFSADYDVRTLGPGSLILCPRCVGDWPAQYSGEAEQTR